MELRRLGFPTVQVLLRNFADNPVQAETAASALAIGAHEDSNVCWHVIGRVQDGAESPLLTAVVKLATAPPNVASFGLRRSAAVVLARCAALAGQLEPNENDTTSPWFEESSTLEELAVHSQDCASQRLERSLDYHNEDQTEGVTGARRLVEHDCVHYICAALEREIEAVDFAVVDSLQSASKGGGSAVSSDNTTKSGRSASSSKQGSSSGGTGESSCEKDSEDALKNYWLLSLAHLVRASTEACRSVARRKHTVEVLTRCVAARIQKPSERGAQNNDNAGVDSEAISSEARSEAEGEILESSSSSQLPFWALQRDWALFILRKCTTPLHPDSAQAVSALASCKAAAPLLYLLLTPELAPEAPGSLPSAASGATASAAAPSVPSSTSKLTSGQRGRGAGRVGVVERRRGEPAAARSSTNSSSSNSSSVGSALRDVVAAVSVAAQQQPQPGSPAVRAGVAALVAQCLAAPSLGLSGGPAAAATAAANGASKLFASSPAPSDFGRQFFRLSLALTPAAQPSAAAVARFFPLLISDDHHTQHIALAVLRRALEGSKPALSLASSSKSSSSSSSSSRGSDNNPLSRTRSSSNGLTTSSDRSSSSGGSNRASREQRGSRKTTSDPRKQGLEDGRPGGASSGARDLKRAASLAMAQHHAMSLASEVRTECASRGLLPTLTWLLLHAHTSVRTGAAAVLESLVFGPSGCSSSADGNGDIGSSSGIRGDGGCCVALMEQGCVPLLVLAAHSSLNDDAFINSTEAGNKDGTVATAERVLAACHANLSNLSTSTGSGSSDNSNSDSAETEPTSENTSSSEKDRLEALAAGAGSSDLRANIALALTLLDCHMCGKHTSGNGISQRNFPSNSEFTLPVSPVDKAPAVFPPAPSSGDLAYSPESKAAPVIVPALGAPVLSALCTMLKSHASRTAGLFALRAFDSLLFEAPDDDDNKVDGFLYQGSDDVADVTVVVAASCSGNCPWRNPALSKSALLGTGTSNNDSNSGAVSAGDVTTKSLGGVRMSCPPLGVLQRASPWLADLVQHASLAAAEEDAAAEAAPFDRAVVPKFAKLFGPYRVWEEVFAHAVGDHASWLARYAAESPGKSGSSAAVVAGLSNVSNAGHESVSFADAAHRYSLPALLCLLKLAEPYGFRRLAKQYADSVCEVHLRRDTCATVLRGAVQSRHWPLALVAFRTALEEVEKATEETRGRNTDGGDIGTKEETWIEPLMQAVGDFLCAAFHVALPRDI